MKLRRFITAICICSLLAGCNGQSPQLNSNNTQPSVKKPSETYMQETSQTISNDFLQAEQGTTVTLNAFGLKQVVIREKMIADSLSSNVFTVAYVLEDASSSSQQTYLFLKLANKFLLYELASKSFEDDLFLCDIDGDSIQEIILQQCLGLSGGAGSYLSRVFRVEEETITEIFTTSANNNYFDFDTGFDSAFLEDKKLLITNETVNYQIVLDISSRYRDEFFDSSGKCARDIHIWCDSFYEFIPKDIDNDNIYEIVCKQYVSLDGHADGIGYAISVLKYNAEAEQFEIIEASFSTE